VRRLYDGINIARSLLIVKCKRKKSLILSLSAYDLYREMLLIIFIIPSIILSFYHFDAKRCVNRKICSLRLN